MFTINLKSVIFIGFSTLLFLLSCDKDENMNDEGKPTITLISPSMDDNYSNGDTVKIHAVITDNDELHEISAKMTHSHMGTSMEVWNLETHSHQASYTLEEEFVIDVQTMHNDYHLKIEVSDHNGNVGTEEFHFHVM